MLSKNRLNRSRREEEPEVNPMDGIANLVDAMLVLAVGIMLALVINWNLDITNQTQADPDMLQVNEDELTQASDEDAPDDTEDLQEMGKVYYDKDTGTYYIVSGE